MKNIEVTILKALCKAELANIKAHECANLIRNNCDKELDYWSFQGLKNQKNIYYKSKHNNIQKALRLLKSCKCYNIKYKIERNVPDQNGIISNIYYFEIKIENEWKQISFHSFNKIKKICHNGHKEIAFDGDINGSANNVELIMKKFNFNLES